MRSLVTGGSGFIGSHLSYRLAESGWDVLVLDRNPFSNDSRLPRPRSINGSIKTLIGDCTKTRDVKNALKDIDAVFHFAANPHVRLDFNDSKNCFIQNVLATHVVLEEFSRSEAETMVFPSTSAVYGEARIIPTDETAPLEPVSIYAGSKLACEALITSYAYQYNKRAIILRLANVVGARSNHGIVFDLVQKLKGNQNELEILGDGNQSKSYLHIADCVKAIQSAHAGSKHQLETFNVGTNDQVSVRRIAEIILEEAGLSNVELKFACVDGKKGGWLGDVPNMLLDINRLKSTGWRPVYDSEEAIRLAARSLLIADRTIGVTTGSVNLPSEL